MTTTPQAAATVSSPRRVPFSSEQTGRCTSEMQRPAGHSPASVRLRCPRDAPHARPAASGRGHAPGRHPSRGSVCVPGARLLLLALPSGHGRPAGAVGGEWSCVSRLVQGLQRKCWKGPGNSPGPNVSSCPRRLTWENAGVCAPASSLTRTKEVFLVVLPHLGNRVTVQSWSPAAQRDVLTGHSAHSCSQQAHAPGSGSLRRSLQETGTCLSLKAALQDLSPQNLFEKSHSQGGLVHRARGLWAPHRRPEGAGSLCRIPHLKPKPLPRVSKTCQPSSSACSAQGLCRDPVSQPCGS